MSQVDFTLNEVRGVVREVVREEVPEMVRREVRAVVDEEVRGLVREEVKQAVEESEFRITKTIQETFDQYDQRFEDIDAQLVMIAGDVRSIRRLVGQHSKEIMELKAHTA